MSSFSSNYFKHKKKLMEEGKKVKKEKDIDLESPFKLNTINLISPEEAKEIAPVADIAPVATEKEDERKWFQKGAFEDGYQFGDVTKTIAATILDTNTNIATGVLGMGEKVIDAGAMLIGPSMAGGPRKFLSAREEVEAEVRKSFAGEATESDDPLADLKQRRAESKQSVADFVAKDLYDEEKIAKTIISAPLGKLYGIDAETDSVFGEKLDSLAQSGGQLAATAALQAAGVPWWLTTGATAFGAESENALRQGATLEEATISAAVAAGAEILTEKISGGISFGGKAFDDVLTDSLARGISNKVVRTLLKFGIDAVGEGGEEVLSNAINAVGQKLTYDKEKDLSASELFFSEEAFENFIGGAVLGGISSGGKTVKAVAEGVDPVTGLKTDTEQKVVDKLYKDAIAEAEAGGKKLTEKEKQKVYDSVLNDLDKGYISTDTIEEILGGEDFKAYKDTVDSEDSLIKELDELRNMKSGDMTDIQRDRLTELKGMNLTDTTKRDGLKTKLGESVFGLVKDTRLSESYNERARRSQSFEADLSQYDGEQAAIVQKAIDSGILNNTNRTHELVDFVSKISADTGRSFDFTNNEKLKESGFAVEGATVNGYVWGGGITINIQSSKYLNSVVGHEVTHVLEHTELYDALAETVIEYAKSKGEYDSRRRDIWNLYKNTKGFDVKTIDSELVADLVGDYLFTDTDFINSLSTKHRNVFEKIFDKVKHLYKMATAGSKEARELEKVKRAFEEAYKVANPEPVIEISFDDFYDFDDEPVIEIPYDDFDDERQYSLSDSDGKKLTKEQGEYFKDSKMRDENGNLKVMYHGSQDAGFHIFDPSHSDDGISLFFVDRNDVAATYSGTSETYEAKTIHTAEDMNNFIESIGVEGYEVVEKDGKFTLIYEGMRVADADTARGIYEEFCWYEGVGDGDANYKVYLNLTNPLEIDAKGRPWNKIDAEFSKEVYDKYNSLTAEEKAALVDLAEWEDFSLFNRELQDAALPIKSDDPYITNLAQAYYKMGEDCNIYDLFSVAADNFSEEAMRENARKYLKTRDYAQRAKEGGYDGVIFKNVIDNGGYSNGDEGASTVAIAFSSEQVKSVANEKPTGDPDIRFSLSRNDELMRNAEDVNSKNLGIDLTTARQQRQAIYEYMMQNADRLKLPEDIEGNTAIKNSSYDITEENTTVCIRSMAADALCDAVAEELGRPLTVEDTIRISQDLMNYTDEPECVYCYVATDRKAYREFLGSYYKQMQSAIEAIKSGKNAEEVYKTFLDGRKDTKNMRARFAMWERIADGGKMITAKDLASERMMQNAMRDPELAAQVKDARAYAQSASWAKKRMGYQAYNGHILDWSERRINDLNKHYGLRFYSFSDFSPAFVLENMQQMTDASVRGLKGLAYTKVLDFAEIFAPTGANINISVFGYDQNGAVAQDGMMGADWKGAQDLRNRYENVGITFVATNDAQIEWALDQDWIDVVIPYHLVRTGQAVAKAFGYTNYTAESGDTKGANWKKGDKKTIYPAEHNNDKQTYLAALAEANLEPRFARWVNHPNYMKLVNETRRSAKDTPPMKAEFNVEAAKASLEQMAKRGGYFVPIGGDYANMRDIASEIADNIRGGTQHSLSPEGEASKRYGTWGIRGEEVALAPVQVDETVAPTVDETVSQTDTPIGETDYAEDVAPSMSEIYGDEYEPVENAYTVEQELDNVRNEMFRIYEQYNALKDEGKDAEAQPLFDSWLALNEHAQALNEKVEGYRAEEQSYLDSLSDADAPPEMDEPYNGDGGVIDPFEERDIKAVGNKKVKAYMFENPEVKPFFREEANILLGELNNSTKGERFYTETPDGRPGVYGAESYGVWQGTSRDVTPDIAKLLDNGKGNGKGYSYAEIEQGLKDIIEDNGKENNACSKRIEFILNDRLMNGYITDGGVEIEANQAYRDLIKEKGVTEYSEEAFKRLIEDYNANLPKRTEDIAPVADQQAAPAAPSGDPTEPSQIARVLPSTPKAEKKSNLWQKVRSLVFDKQSVIEDISLKAHNRSLMGKADFMLRSESRAQRHIKNKLMPILEKVEAAGDRTAFEEYAYHLHNVDRMSLEAKAAPTIAALTGKFGHLKIEQVKAIAAKKITDKTTEKTANTIREAKEYLNALETKNKPVFGDEVTADVSRDFVKKFEAAHPEAKAISEAITEYNNELRQMLIDGGVISQKTADLWAQMYPHYVPIRRVGKDGAAVTVPLDTRRTGVNAPIKRATGGNSDMESLLDVMGSRTEQVYRAIARNNFGVELMHTLDTVVDTQPTNIDEILDSFENEELLKKGENGANPTFTVFEDGERVTFDITEELYDALKPTDGLLKADVPVMSLLTKIQRGLLTQYNPTFIATNAIKDMQDVLINSQHPGATYKQIPAAAKELFNAVRGKEGRWIAEYMENGGEDLTYFDSKKQVFKEEDSKVKKVLGFVPGKIAAANDFVEKLPRLAEYMASRKKGASVEVAMLDAARVTTNFAAGGDLTKFANKNGFTFLNASVQGFNQQVRNVREAKANGLKGTMQLAAKIAIAGLPIMLFNALRWDDDEDYAELSDYVKDNYYIVAKYGDGKFVRIPKGRAVAVIQSALEQMKNLITGDDEVDMARFGQLMVSNLAPNDPLENNVLAPISDVINNKTWYGEALVPTRLQDVPAAEQFDETTDAISKWLGEVTNTSPYKWNYILDQYSGGVGDVVLPMLTPESDGHNVIAPFSDKFTTDSVMKNRNISDFYEKVDELTKSANSANATDEDILKSKYMNSVSSELGELYAQKREIQNGKLSDKEKDAAVREIQKQIVELTKTGLSSYENISYEGNGEYAIIGDRYYQWYTPKNGEAYWRKLDDDQVVKYNLTKNAGGAHYVTDGNVHYRLDEEGEWTKISDRQLERQNEVTKSLGITPEEYWSKTDISFLPMSDGEYEYAYNNPEKYAVAKAVGGYDAFKSYSSDLYDIKADKDENGKSISGSRKEKVLDYINSLDADDGTKMILFKSEYNADDTYNYDIIEYLNSRDDISYDEMETILKELGFTVDASGNISWD